MSASAMQQRKVDKSRVALFGNGYGAGPAGSSSADIGAAYTTSFMEKENDEHIGLLHGKVSQLKQMSIQIGDFVNQDNKLLDDMGGSFDRTNGLLSGTMKRLDALAQTKDGRHMIYLGLFVLGLFIFLYMRR